MSWAAVDKYQADPLCNGDEDDRKWKQAVKEAKEEKDKRRNYSSRRGDRRSSPVRYSGRDSYGYRDTRSYGGRHGGSDGRQDTSRENQTCHRCAKKGHIRADCHVRKETKRP